MLYVLSKANRPVTAGQIAKFGKISYNGAKSNLETLEIRGLVVRVAKQGSKIIYWRLR